MKVSSAIEKIIAERGKEILKSSDIVQAMVMDYVTGYENEKKLFKISCKSGILNYAYEILELSDIEQRRILASKAKSWLKQEAFLSEENARIAINMILEALNVELCMESDRHSEESTLEIWKQSEKNAGKKAVDRKAAMSGISVISDSRENYLWKLVISNSKVTPEENEEIFVYGKSLLKNNNNQKAFRCIRFAAQNGLQSARTLLKYYEEGNGTARDWKEYYRHVGVYKFGDSIWDT